MDLNKEEYLKLLRKIGNKAYSSQRDLSSELGISLGKINYCLKALKGKGLIKMKNFKKSKNKLKYLYVLTPKGISEKTKITLRFMKIKIKEYDELKEEIIKTKK
jgi:EPS-associated MarR family transcriptional regulator|tara:strand:- start:92 stop:403 length:312 start_codon:yes stop_codon:yes gene_type:complete